MDPIASRRCWRTSARGACPSTARSAELRELPFRDPRLRARDTHRHLRTGFPEVVLGEGKTPEQIAAS